MAADRAKFVILSTQRSGSTWLVDLLDHLGNTAVYGELFLPRKRVWDGGSCDHPRFVEAEPGGLAVRPFSVFSYLDNLYHKPGAVGFKLMYSQLRVYPEILAFLCWRRIQVLHLVRHNHLDQIISLEMMSLRGQAHVLAGQQAPEAVQVYLDPETLVGRMKRLERKIGAVRRLLALCRLPHLEIAYEDLLAAPSHFWPLWEFLAVGLQGDAPQSRLTRIRQAGHADVIGNYDEVRTALDGSEFAGLIEETVSEGAGCA